MRHLSRTERLVFCFAATALVLLGIAATTTQTRDLNIQNTSAGTVKLTLQGPGLQSANALEIRRGGNLELGIPGTNTVAVLKQRLGLDGGVVITTSDCTVTGTFAMTYSAAPSVVTTQKGLDTTTTNVLAITTTGFVLRTGKATQTNTWVAIGVP